MESPGFSVEGPDFAEQIRTAEQTVEKLQEARWDFAAAPETFAVEANADVFAKEMVVVYDGTRLTRVGRLALAGVGRQFNLMGPTNALATFRTADPDLLNSVNTQIGSRGMRDFPEFMRFGEPQSAQFSNFTMFFQLRDLVFWSVLYRSGVSPSTLEHMRQNFAAGMIVQNALYAPPIPSKSRDKPSVVLVTDLTMSFPTTAMEWMDRPLYGGLIRETIHIENLLTPERTSISHPYLPLVGEGRIEHMNRQFHLRRFAGISQKSAVRGPGVSVEHETSFGSSRGWIRDAVTR